MCYNDNIRGDLGIMNEELKNYFTILCDNDYPNFINKYLEVKELVRLKGIGQFCGCDYTKLFHIKFWYSRYDHSLATALMTWHFTKDKVQTIAALYHDLGTPVFSHSIDFMLGDSIKQESSELDVKEIIMNSKEIKEKLLEDNIDVNLICDLKKYTIIENKKPKLCVDRLDGILHTVFIWLNKWTIEQVAEVYKHIVVLTNEDQELELGFDSKESGELFYEAVHLYSMVLQENEDKYTLSYIANATNYLIQKKVIQYNDLYQLSENEVINKFNETIPSWSTFENATCIIRTEEEPQAFSVSLEAKKRTVLPICNVNGNNVRLNKLSDNVISKIEDYNNFKDSKYAYIEGILPFEKI